MSARNGLWKSDPILSNQIAEMRNMLSNEVMSRSAFMRKFFDERRDINAECGYPESSAVDARAYQDLFDREPIANRIVSFLPKECWQRNPKLYETASAEEATQFEVDWDELCANLQGNSWFQDEKGNAMWEACQQADVLSRIGSFGILLMGWDDGKPLDQPIDMMEVKTKAEPVTKYDEKKDRDVIVGHRMTVNVSKRKRKDSPLHPKELRALNALPNLNDGEKDAIERMKGEKAEVLEKPEAEEPEVEVPEPSKGLRKLLYLRPFAETLVQVVRYEYDPTNPRYGQPNMYRVTLNDPADMHSGIGMPNATVMVHWSRVIHIADRYSNSSSSTCFAPPALRPVLNPVLDIRKARAASAEAYWKNCQAALSMETHPSLGGDVDVDTDAIRDALENRNNSLTRDLITSGMTAKVIAPQAVDPTPFINVQLEAIAIQLACPIRILKGAERGELASSQDDANWDDRVMGRCTGYCTPRIIVQIVDRCIAVGGVAVPEGYSCEWPDFESLSKLDKVNIAAAKIGAIASYIQGDVQSLIQPEDMLESWLGEDAEDIQAWMEKSAKFVEERDAEQAAMQEEQLAAMQDNGQEIDFDKDGNPKAKQDAPPFGKPPFVKNAWSDAAREAALLARQARRQGKNAQTKEQHMEAGDAHTFASMSHVQAARESYRDGRPLKGERHKSLATKHLARARSHYNKFGPRPVRDVTYALAHNALEALNAFCPTGPGGGVDPTCSPNGETRGATPLETIIAKEATTPIPVGKPTHAPRVEHDSDGDGVTDAARIGVPASTVPPPPGIGRIPNLTPHERAVESSFADAYEKNPGKMAEDYRQLVTATTKPGDVPTFATDDAKALSAAWSHPDQSVRSQNRATLNTPLHQTANAIAKRAFLSHLDSLQKGDEILVTVGGCGAGKGYALKNVPEALAAKSQTKAVWDSAGDQNATENPWIQKEAESRGLKVTYIHVHADPYTQWADPGKGVVSRAANPADGRMVDAKVFADSYAIGARNHQAFYEQNKDNPSAKFLFLDNTGKPKLTDRIHESALKLDAGELAKYAQGVVAKSDTAPEHVKRGALMGERIWRDETRNAFCPTGPGGGVDPTCSPSEAAVATAKGTFAKDEANSRSGSHVWTAPNGVKVSVSTSTIYKKIGRIRSGDPSTTKLVAVVNIDDAQPKGTYSSPWVEHKAFSVRGESSEIRSALMQKVSKHLSKYFGIEVDGDTLN